MVRSAHPERTQPAVDEYYIRHAASVYADAFTQWKESGDSSALSEELLQTPDINHPISQRGRRQLPAIRHAVEKYIVGVHSTNFSVICSPMLRAVQTRAGLQVPTSVPVRHSHLIVEMSYGTMHHVHPRDWDTQYADYFAAKKRCEWSASVPGGESYRSIYHTRLVSLEKYLTEKHLDGAVVHITHCRFMETVRATKFGMSPTAFHEWVTASKDVRIHTGQIDHYSRRNPQTKAVHHDRLWFRSIHSTHDDGVLRDSGWEEVLHK